MIESQASPNIAFIKYWGKQPSKNDEDRNIGINPSISMTLSKATTTVQIVDTDKDKVIVNDEDASKKDREKVLAHKNRIFSFLGVQDKALHISSSNNFPSASGIASSASAYSALTMALCASAIGKERTKELLRTSPETLSALSRRGSGSASRSIYSGFSIFDGEYAKSIDSDWKLYDTILIFSDKEKKVSSTDGHKKALSSPLYKARLKKLPSRIDNVKSAINHKNLHELGPIIEEEALEMHQISRTAQEPVEYLLPETKAFVDHVSTIKDRDFYFTIDAGPNIHLISDRPIASKIKPLLEELGLNPQIWEDRLGTHPTLV